MDDFWREFDENSYLARDKYENNIYCPLCKKAKLTWADGAKLRYFKAFTNHVDCDYQFEEANRHELDMIKKQLSDQDIACKLNACINRIFRGGDEKNHDDVVQNKLSESKKENNALTVLIEKENKHIPTRTWERIKIEDENVNKIYAGKCKSYWQRVGEKKERINIYIYSCNNEKYIGKIIITKNVEKYLTKELSLISQDKGCKSSVIISLWAAPQKSSVGYDFILTKSTFIKVK